MLNGFPFFPLNVPALKPDLLRENSCVIYSNFFYFPGGGREGEKKHKKEEATTVISNVAQKGSGHASQSPKCILGADARGYWVTAWSAQP